MSLNELATDIHATATEKGFWNVEEVSVDFVLSKLALVHSEVSETLEAVRKSKGERAVVEEMADTVIRILDLYEGMREHGLVESDFDEVMEAKMRYNTTRPQKHGVLA